MNETDPQHAASGPAPTTIGEPDDPSAGTGAELGAGTARATDRGGPPTEPVTDGGLPAGADPTPRRRPRSLALPIALVAIAILGGAGLFLAGFAIGGSEFAHPGTPADEAALFQPFWDTWDSITNSYVGQYDRQKLVEGAIKGMITALGDPFSGYMSPEDLQNARESLNGQFEGIGAEVSAETAPSGTACAPLAATCRMVVLRPMPGSPAEKAGLLANDVLTAIDGVTVDGLTLDSAIAKVRGPKGSTVTLSVARAGRAPFDLPIVRDVISQPQVSTRDLPGGAAYIQLSAFSDSAAVDFATAVRAAVARGATRIVVDLRDNGGGYVTAARSIASQFIASGPIFYTVGANGDRIATDAAPGGAATGSAYHVAVLVNGGSASASEIVAGALQDTGRALLVGQQTYGKGTMQEWIDLTYDNQGRIVTSGGFRLTIAKWLTPDGRSIHQKGLSPDVVVTSSGADPGPTGDPYIDAALKALGSTARVPHGLARAA